MRVFSSERLAEAFKNMNLSRLAIEVGVTPHFLYSLRDGKSKPSVDTLAALADALDKPVDYFFEQKCKRSYKGGAA